MAKTTVFSAILILLFLMTSAVYAQSPSASGSVGSSSPAISLPGDEDKTFKLPASYDTDKSWENASYESNTTESAATSPPPTGAVLKTVTSQYGVNENGVQNPQEDSSVSAKPATQPVAKPTPNPESFSEQKSAASIDNTNEVNVVSDSGIAAAKKAAASQEQKDAGREEQRKPEASIFARINDFFKRLFRW